MSPVMNLVLQFVGPHLKKLLDSQFRILTSWLANPICLSFPVQPPAPLHQLFQHFVSYSPNSSHPSCNLPDSVPLPGASGPFSRCLLQTRKSPAFLYIILQTCPLFKDWQPSLSESSSTQASQSINNRLRLYKGLSTFSTSSTLEAPASTPFSFKAIQIQHERNLSRYCSRLRT